MNRPQDDRAPSSRCSPKSHHSKKQSNNYAGKKSIRFLPSLCLLLLVMTHTNLNRHTGEALATSSHNYSPFIRRWHLHHSTTAASASARNNHKDLTPLASSSHVRRVRGGSSAVDTTATAKSLATPTTMSTISNSKRKKISSSSPPLAKNEIECGVLANHNDQEEMSSSSEMEDNNEEEKLQTGDDDADFIDLPIETKYIAETNLPTDIGHFRLRAYRVKGDQNKNIHVGNEPCVIYSTKYSPFGKVGRTEKNIVPVRIHDQCFTSEVFRSQRCDCKEQLKMSLEYIQEHGGAVIYLQQEGRGIGLANKVAAYALQDFGMDTVDANLHLGFPEDCRQYGVVPSMLADMGIDGIQLITNNPRKIDRMRALGVDVAGTIPMVVKQANPYNRKYLETKVARMNHSNFGATLSLEPTYHKPGLNGVMAPQKATVAENYINEGEEMAAAAMTAALDDDETQTGVSAGENGYCFGRKSVEDAIAAVARGELVVVVDDEDRENEGDFIMAADLCTPETMATIIRYSSGVVCVGMEGKRMDELQLPAMVSKNEDPKGTAFSVTVDAAKKHGITTGISAIDRAKTVRFLSKPDSTADDLVRPGHIFPLRARDGGVLTRDGHTEAAVDLSRLAGLNPAGVLCEIVSEEDPVHMARLPELKRFCKKHGFVMTSIVDIAQYRRDTGL